MLAYGYNRFTCNEITDTYDWITLRNWNYDHFEKADIVEVTKSDYAGLHTEDGKWFISTGLYENGSPSEQKLYKYEYGKLIEVN